jgi:PAS domain S-box-containing protein
LRATREERSCTFASESAGGMLGYEPEELLGADLREFGCPACLDNASGSEEMCVVHRTLQTGEVCRSERANFRRIDGTSLHVDCTSQPIIEEGETAYLFGLSSPPSNITLVWSLP